MLILVRGGAEENIVESVLGLYWMGPWKVSVL